MHSPRFVLASTRHVIVLLTNSALASVFLIASLLAPAEEAKGLEPFLVYVAHDEVYARCGPAEEYYRTDPLRQGQELEVYVETEDGWLGIRPPENSFCWIPASAVELSGNDDTGEVIEDRSVSWIGTHLGRARQYRWQVQLAAGEPVTIIGRSERDGPDGPQLWYRIVPPSGEFRWVHRDQTVHSTEALVASMRKQQASQRNEIAVMPVERRPMHAKQYELEDDVTDDNRLASTDRLQRSSDGTASRNGGERSTPAGKADERQIASDETKSSRRANRDPAIKPIDINEIPSFRRAPEPNQTNRPTTESESTAIAALSSEAVIGSGLNEAWNSVAGRDISAAAHTSPDPAVSAPTDIPANNLPAPPASLATASFLGQPRLVEIGAGLDASAPTSNESAGDGNWVSGTARSNAVAQVSGIRPLPAQTLAPSFQTNRTRQVSPARLAEIENEVRGANVEKLQIVLSHLMANQASSGEVAPVIDEANRLARMTNEEVTAGRARLIAERAEQYQRIAERREGSGSIASSSPLVIPASQGTSQGLPTLPAHDLTSVLQTSMGKTSQGNLNVAQSPANLRPVSNDSEGGPAVTTENQSAAFTESGFLVQVYSARPNSPPFALTDHAGNTVAYVTPAPGINLRNHLNSRINVMGNRGFLQGLNTPHILVTKAVRSHE